MRGYEEAIAAFQAVLAVEPANPSALAGLANCRLLTCDWHGVADIAERARAATRSGDWSGLDPFAALCIFDEPAEHLAYARAYVRRSVPAAGARPAPVQVHYFGYLGTMGADFIDYVIADDIVLPSDQQAFYVEKIVHLPGCFQINDSVRSEVAHVPGRGELGLPETGFVFCCFNN